MAIWYILWSWYISPRFGILYQEKSGNPAETENFEIVVGEKFDFF
jgi:hypothetical protein